MIKGISIKTCMLGLIQIIICISSNTAYTREPHSASQPAYLPVNYASSCVTGIINVYTPVLSICDDGNITVLDPNLFKPGDKVLLHQAQGAVCDSTNSATCGDLIELGGAGLFEFNTIRSIQGNMVTFEYYLLNNYNLEGKVQMVSVPQLGDTAVCDLTCPPWNGTIGGILVFEGGRIEMTGNIDVSGKGFRGGMLTPWPSNMLETILDYIGQDANDGGMKGEGIAILPSKFQWGRGKWTLGGGGGNNHNAGGGGGAGAGSGGHGGTYLAFPLTTRGIGGVGLHYGDRLFFGGGGGAGHDNNNRGTSGASGGGIVMIKVKELVAQANYSIIANGNPGLLAGIDGAGGGGGGGIIWLLADAVSPILEWSAVGGKGGNNNSFPDDYQCVGTGGGGGGGKLFSNLPLANVNLEGGQSGLVVNNATYFACVPKPQDGYAEEGMPGFLDTEVPENTSIIPYFLFGFESLEVIGSCDSLILHIVLKEHSPDLFLYLNDVPFQSGDSLFLDSSGNYAIRVINQCMEWDTLVNIVQPDSLILDLETLVHPTCKGGFGSVNVQGIGGVPQYIYSKNNGTWQNSGYFDNLSPGSHLIQVSDARGCIAEELIEIIGNEEIVEVIIDSFRLEWSCRDSNTIFVVHTVTTANEVVYFLNGSATQSFGEFTNLPPGIYELVAQDSHGCQSDTIIFEVIDYSTPDTFHHSIVLCKGEVYSIGSSIYSQSGHYEDFVSATVGCDSLIFTQLYFLDTSFTSIKQLICKGQIIEWADQTFDKPGNYTLLLNNQHGCDSTLHITIVPEKPVICDSIYCRVYIPNAFSPNNDGINDIFRPYSPTIEFQELRIYDRWGGLLYLEESTMPTWNGAVGDTWVDPGVFVYVIKGICGNGEPILLKGDVTVTY